MDFRGLSAFPITPADQDGRVKTDELSVLLERLRQAEVSSVGLLGSTGSYVYLSRAERRRAIETAVNVLKGDVPLIVGAGALRTDDACELAKDAAKAGADALLLAPVSYLPLTEEEVFQHFVSVASVTDLPLVIYNNPGTTHFSFSTDLLKRLAAVSDIAAVKMPLPAGKSVSDELAFLRAELPENFAIGYSGDWGCGEALLAGSDTFYSGFAGLFPEMATRLAMSAGAGDVSETHRLDAELEPIWSLFRAHGSLRVIYAAAKHLGLTTCDAPRPVLPLGKDITRKVAETIEKLSG
jgi:4-hydroxy-tetrahydrodipicolinate synthase